MSRMQGWNNSNLTEKGINNAIALRKYLKDIKFNVIYSSTSQRTIHTAQLIRGDREIDIITDENLREIGLGQWEGKTSEEIKALDPEGHNAFWNKPHLYKSDSGENFYQVRERLEAVLKKIISENPEGNVLIVTHGGATKTIMSIFKAIPIEKLWEQPFIHGTSLSIVEINNDKATVLAEGEMPHLNE